MTEEHDLDRCLSYIRCHTRALDPHATSGCILPPSITISRQAGCGAMAVASRLADYLQAREPAKCGWTVFDKSLVAKILQEHHLPEDVAKFMPEDRISAIQDMLEELMGLHPSALTLLRETSETILHLATLGHVILVGRGAVVVTRRMKNVFHVRLVAPMEQRIEKEVRQNGLTREAAIAFIQKEDAGRKRFQKEFFKTDIDDPAIYDLVVNLSRISQDHAAELIGNAVLRWSQSLR
ncbi:MAG: cytidylate kinase-like family protein [bacterium]